LQTQIDTIDFGLIDTTSSTDTTKAATANIANYLQQQIHNPVIQDTLTLGDTQTKLVVMNQQDGGSKGISMWSAADTKWGIYMATPGVNKSYSGSGTAVAGNGFDSYAMRFRSSKQADQGIIWENEDEQLNMSLRGSDGYLFVRGDITTAGELQASGEITSYASDARLKTNITPIQDPLSIIEKLDGYTFQWRSDVEGLPMRGKHDIGLIVQDLERAGLSKECTAPAPFDNTNKYKTIHYNKIHAISVSAIKELHTREKDLQDRIDALEQKVEFLLSQVDSNRT
jgi:hypothetical protein